LGQIRKALLIARRILTNALFKFVVASAMANIQQRAGAVTIRVGGNSQEAAVLVNQTSDGQILKKDLLSIANLFFFNQLYFLAHLSCYQ
jgi:hypothetical protein